MKMQLRLSACAALLAMTGCAIHKYRPAPLSSASSLTIFQARSLEDVELKQFIETNTHQAITSWPLRSWSLEQLALAAYYYSPDLDFARASVIGWKGRADAHEIIRSSHARFGPNPVHVGNGALE